MLATTHVSDELNGVLQGEIAAVETYRQALEKIEEASVRSVLESCMNCHADRVLKITETVLTLGGVPVTSSGPWGAFAKMMEGGAKVFGDKACISMLEEGEDKGMADYKRLLIDPNSTVRNAAQTLMYLQEGTHGKMRKLKHRELAK